jgi:hypothetical protein
MDGKEMKEKRKQRFLISLLGLLLLLAMLPLTGYAGVPQNINYQAYLADPEGTPIDGTIKDGTVTSVVIANNAVTIEKVANDAITGEKIGSGVVTSTNIANGAVSSIKIRDGSVANADLANNAVNIIHSKKINSWQELQTTIRKHRIYNLGLTMGKVGSEEQIEKRRQKSTHSPIIVNLEVSKAPYLNEIITVSLKINSVFEAKNTEAAIILPHGAIKVDGNLEWKGDLKRKIPVELIARIKFFKQGNWIIKGYAKHVLDKDTVWGDVDYVYLNVAEGSGSFGFEKREGGEKVEKP